MPLHSTQIQSACDSEKSFDLLSEKWRKRVCIEDYLIMEPLFNLSSRIIWAPWGWSFLTVTGFLAGQLASSMQWVSMQHFVFFSSDSDWFSRHSDFFDSDWFSRRAAGVVSGRWHRAGSTQNSTCFHFLSDQHHHSYRFYYHSYHHS